MLKILMIVTDASGGLLQYTAQLSNALSKTKDQIQVTVIAPINANTRLFDNSVKLIQLSVGNNVKNFIIDSIFITRLIKFITTIRNEHPDIIHFQTWNNLWTCLFLPFFKKYKIITTLHAVKPNVGTKKIRQIIARNLNIRYSDCLIIHGKKAENELKEIGVEKKYYIIPHGDYSFFTKYCKKIEETNSVLFFGNIIDYKGLEFLIKSEPLITQKIPNVKIIIAGQGNLEKYRKLIKHENSFEIYNEFIPDKQVAELFQKAKIVVLPYIEASQSGIIPIAYAFKKPVVVTNVGCIPEVVDDGVTGFIVPPRDVNALANAIIKLLKDDELRKQMGENAYKKMKEELSWDKIAEKTIEIYKEMIRDKSCK